MRFIRTALAALALTVGMTLPAAAADFGFAVGDRLPVFTYVDINGTQHSTAEFTGRPFVFKRGADWCAPCKAERPHAAAFLRAHPEIPIVVAEAPPSGTRATPEVLSAQLDRDVRYNAAKGMDAGLFVRIVSRQPGAEAVPLPATLTDVPLTILVDGSGIILDRWVGTKPPRARADFAFQEHAEAVFLCAGVPLPAISADGRAAAKALCGR